MKKIGGTSDNEEFKEAFAYLVQSLEKVNRRLENAQTLKIVTHAIGTPDYKGQAVNGAAAGSPISSPSNKKLSAPKAKGTGREKGKLEAARAGVHAKSPENASSKAMLKRRQEEEEKKRRVIEAELQRKQREEEEAAEAERARERGSANEEEKVKDDPRYLRKNTIQNEQEKRELIERVIANAKAMGKTTMPEIMEELEELGLDSMSIIQEVIKEFSNIFKKGKGTK